MMKINKNFQYIVIVAFLLAMFAGGLNNDVVFGELSGNAVGGNLVLNVTDVVYTISGTVYDKDSKPIKDATVSANTGASVVSLLTGDYALYPVPDGGIKVLVSADSYATKLQHVNVESANVSGIDFILNKYPSFVDVPLSHWTWSYVEAFYTQGITTGCSPSPLAYCPDNGVTRAEMAVFIERALKGGDYTPPVTTLTFTDTTSHWAKYWIEQFKTDGITTGCNATGYCPDQYVTRAEMAVFIERALRGGSYTPPVTSITFTDTTSHWAKYWIEQFKADGITTGCTATKYCPDQVVTRGEMAVFLTRAFGYPRPPQP